MNRIKEMHFFPFHDDQSAGKSYRGTFWYLESVLHPRRPRPLCFNKHFTLFYDPSWDSRVRPGWEWGPTNSKKRNRRWKLRRLNVEWNAMHLHHDVNPFKRLIAQWKLIMAGAHHIRNIICQIAMVASTTSHLTRLTWEKCERTGEKRL